MVIQVPVHWSFSCVSVSRTCLPHPCDLLVCRLFGIVVYQPMAKALAVDMGWHPAHLCLLATLVDKDIQGIYQSPHLDYVNPGLFMEDDPFSVFGAVKLFQKFEKILKISINDDGVDLKILVTRRYYLISS